MNCILARGQTDVGVTDLGSAFPAGQVGRTSADVVQPGVESRAIRIAAILSRKIDPGPPKWGRVRTMTSVVKGLSLAGRVTCLHFRNVLDARSLAAAAGVAGALAKSILGAKPLPLQCALYAVPSERSRLYRALDGLRPDLIYVDMVRLAPLIPHLRRRYPAARIICDMDDLISRRFRNSSEREAPVSFGYLDGQVPGFISRLFRSPAVGRRLLAREARALRRTEVEAVASADAVVLVSSREAEILGRYASEACVARARIATILPPADLVRRSAPQGLATPLRFVFVGSDRLWQNALTIDWLLGTWRTLAPKAPLSIVGQQSRPPPPISGVEWLGYVDDLNTVYGPSTVLLAPAFVEGGIKTKILEAFSHGCPVVGNAASFEGLDIDGYPLVCSEEELRALVAEPARQLERLNRAAALGWAFVADEAASEHHQRRWAELVASVLTGDVRETARPEGG